MRNVCATSKELHALMLPYLYRTVSLRVGALSKYHPRALTSDNPGLVHIRTLRVVDGTYAQAFSNEEHLPSLLELMRVLPTDGLRVFESVIIFEIYGRS